MYNRVFVPKEFAVPEGLAWDSCRLRMLSADDVDLDYEAVLESRDRIRGLLDPNSSWPDGLTRREDMVDLAWHEREFTIRHSFAYTLMAADESRCLGCVYLFPSNHPDYDALAFYWVRAGNDADARDDELGRRFRAWLKTSWPFRSVAFPGRDIPWSTWLAQLP